MQVLALNGSPRLAGSNSQRMLEPLLSGMRAAGAEVTQLYLAELEINHCTGCFGCWTRTPGQCAAWRDDMDRLLPLVQAADFLVLAFPLYVYNMPARVKAFFERLLPQAEPWVVPHPTRPGIATHPRRGDTASKLVVLCSAGLLEPEHFGPLEATLEYIAAMTDQPAALLHFRPGGGLLPVPQFQAALAPYFAALTAAGQELVQAGAVTAATQAVLDAKFAPISSEEYYAWVNAYWRSELTKHGHDGTPPPSAPMPPG